jgi:hypothetical protein
VKRDKAKLTDIFLHFFTVDLQNAIPYFPLKSRIHLKEPQITIILETFDPKTIGMQVEMPDKLRQITWCHMKIYKGDCNILPIIK